MKYLPHAAVLLVSVWALFWRLDGTVLWRDEASTASWARAMVEQRSLAPRVYYGDRLIVQAADGHDFNDSFLPVMQGWLQFYVAALAFWLFGAGTVTARLPFVLAGAASLWTLYRTGRHIFGRSLAALGPPLLGALSIHFLTAARQARYYILAILFTSLVLLEFARYLNDPDRAKSWGFWARLGLYGLLTFWANYVSFGGLWLSLGVFVLLRRDPLLLRRFVIVSLILAVPVLAQLILLHGEFVAGAGDTAQAQGADFRWALQYNGTEMFRLLPLLALAPGAVFVFARRSERATPLASMALLTGCIVTVSAAATVAIGNFGLVLPRYYFHIVPALLLFSGLVAARLYALAGPLWCGAFFLFALAWPNLNFYHNWCEHGVERQLTRDTTCNEPIVEFLRQNVKPGEPVAFHRNVQGMMAYFNLPWLRWAAILDSQHPRNQRLRGKLPDELFDDWEGVEWYVLWDYRGVPPRKLSGDFQVVWEYSYINPKSWWDRHQPNRVLGYQVYRRRGAEAAGQSARLRPRTLPE